MVLLHLSVKQKGLQKQIVAPQKSNTLDSLAAASQEVRIYSSNATDADLLMMMCCTM